MAKRTSARQISRRLRTGSMLTVSNYSASGQYGSIIRSPANAVTKISRIGQATQRGIKQPGQQAVNYKRPLN